MLCHAMPQFEIGSDILVASFMFSSIIQLGAFIGQLSSQFLTRKNEGEDVFLKANHTSKNSLNWTSKVWLFVVHNAMAINATTGKTKDQREENTE